MKLSAKLLLVVALVCGAVWLIRWNNSRSEAVRLEAEMEMLRVRIVDGLRDHDPDRPIPRDVLEDIRQSALKHHRKMELLGLDDPASRGPDRYNDYLISRQRELPAAPITEADQAGPAQ